MTQEFVSSQKYPNTLTHTQWNANYFSTVSVAETTRKCNLQAQGNLSLMMQIFGFSLMPWNVCARVRADSNAIRLCVSRESLKASLYRTHMQIICNSNSRTLMMRRSVWVGRNGRLRCRDTCKKEQFWNWRASMQRRYAIAKIVVVGQLLLLFSLLLLLLLLLYVLVAVAKLPQLATLKCLSIRPGNCIPLKGNATWPKPTQVT